MNRIPEVQQETASISGTFFVARETFEAHAESEYNNILDLQTRVRYLEKLIDTKNSPWYKRLWWRIDGWPAWYKVGPKQKRWWHR